MSSAVLQSLFGYTAWANRELLTLLRTLLPEHAGALHTCLRTLNHVYVVDRIFQAHLLGEAHSFNATNTDSTPSLAQLAANLAAADAWYAQYVATLNDAVLGEVIDFQFTDGDRGQMSREEILLHVVTHGSYHRGNVGQVLKSLSIAPPRDVLTRFLHESESAHSRTST